MKQSEQYGYTGTDLLLSTERSLANYNRWIVAQFVRYFHRYTPATVLDFGAGVGSLAVLFRDSTGVMPYTLEIDSKHRQVLQERGFQPYKAIDDIPVGIELIYTSNVLEHIPDDVATLTALRERLSPDGRLIIFVPAFRLIWTTLDEKVGHQRRYTRAMLREKLATAGFEIESIKYQDPVGFLLAFLFKLIGSESGEPSDKSLRFFDTVLLPVSKLLGGFCGPFFGKNVLAVAKPASRDGLGSKLTGGR